MRNPTGYSWLSFLTDYGNSDGYTAICHGQIARHAPGARVIDITHLVPPGDVRRGATVLAEAVPELPPAVHLAVVDPGVGTTRRAVAVVAADHVLVGPDNGLLVWAADALGGAEGAWELDRRELWRHPVSQTFHGRDIFAPVAGRIADGLPPSAAGTAIDPHDLVRLPEPRHRVAAGTAHGEVRTVDHFGNIQLSLRAEDLAELAGAPRPPAHVAIRAGGVSHKVRLGSTFADVAPGELVVFIDSAGRLALARNSGDAAHHLGLGVGATVDVAPAP